MTDYIVGLGEILFDCLPDGKKLGGAPANFAYHVSQLGLNGMAVSAIGDDEDGRLVCEKLSARKGLKTHLETVDFPTGTVQVTLSGAGIPQYDICLGVAYDNIPWTPEIEEIARNTRAVCFGSLAQRTAVSRATIQRFLDTMPALGTLKVFDINLRQQWYSKEIVEESMKRCNVLKINDEEIVEVARMLDLPPIRNIAQATTASEALLQPVDFEDQARQLLRRYELQMLVLTCGAQGSYVLTEGDLHFEPTPKVEVVDTVGAGDSFTGSFCAAILAGKSIPEAHKIGVDVSAFVCTQAGAMPEYPQELIDRVRG
ncbi:MAG: carbohydrate kinase [Bacteroidales bacterium]|nr:carbohydrate kinase [Candidatus Physcousia equi]